MAKASLNREPRADEDPRLTSWDGGSELSLHLALLRPATDCVEAELMHRGAARRRPRAANRLSLAVTTQSTYRQPIAKAFAAAVNARLDCSRDLHQRLHTVLQEAILNALMHGNLGLQSEFGGSLQELAASHDAIERLLQRPAVAASVIAIDAIWNAQMLHVMVRDSGKGFTRTPSPSPGSLSPGSPLNVSSHGRGLLIIEAFCDRVAVLDGGTTVKMVFRR